MTAVEPKTNGGGGAGKAGGERWERIKRILDEALDQAPEERPGFLEGACDGDEALRLEVESLLAQEEPSSGFLTTPIFTLHSDDPPEEDSNLGRRVGPYRLLQSLGRGGMGAVYLAERADGLFDQTVAVKLIKRGMDTEAILHRFHNERQILANLAHDQIAKLYDGGTTDDGLPYFAMEYVEGVPIERYCDAHRLSVTRRLRLFHAVCSAVQVAHQNLVVHRDLKPGNILVTPDGHPKLLDFGIAKLLTPEGAADGGAETVLGELPLTPGYASPEQLRGEPVSTASDVYALGVLLYQLLTGRRPYEADTHRPDLWLQRMAEGEAPKPSTAVRRPHELQGPGGETEVLTPEAVAAVREGDPGRLRRKLAGDLDNIVMTAIAQDRDRRYATAEQLAEDVRRYLEGLPVRAHKPTPAYRAGKFVRRHAWGVAVALVAVLGLVAFAVTATVQERRTAAQRDRAEAVTDYLVEAFQSVDPSQAQGEEVTVREAMKEGVVDIDQKLRGQPLIRATLKDAVGRVYDHLGYDEDARPLLEQALAEHEAALGPDAPEVAQSLQHLGNLLRQGEEEEREKAEVLLRRAVAILRRHFSRDDLELAYGLHNLGAFLQDQGKDEEAEALLREALEIKQRRLGPDDLDVAKTLNSLATLYRSRGELKQAERLFRRVLRIRRTELGSDHPEVANVVNNLAIILEEEGRSDEAYPLYLETLETRLKIYNETHPKVAVAQYNLADFLQDQERYVEAEPLYRQAMEIFRDADQLSKMTTTRRNLATLLAQRGEYAECEVQAREALRFYEQERAPGHWKIVDARSVLGGCLCGLGRCKEAESLLVESYQQLVAIKGEGDSHTQEARARLATLYQAWGKPELAAQYEARESSDPAAAGAAAPTGATPNGQATASADAGGQPTGSPGGQ